MGKEFNNLNDLFKFLDKQIQDTMRNEVAEMAKEKISDAVETTVYPPYSPQYYHRRKSYGGLSDKNNMRVTEIEDGIEVRDIAPPDNGAAFDLDEKIVKWGVKGYPYPRDFYSEAELLILQSDDFKNTLKQGLKNRGVDTD